MSRQGPSEAEAGLQHGAAGGPPARVDSDVAVLGWGCELAVGQFLTSQSLSWLWGRGLREVTGGGSPC